MTEVDSLYSAPKPRDRHRSGTIVQYVSDRLRLGWEFRVLRSITTDVIPRSLGIHKDVHFDMNARIAVNRTERYTVYLPVVRSA